MGNNRFNPMKGIFNRKQKGNSPKRKNNKRKLKTNRGIKNPKQRQTTEKQGRTLNKNLQNNSYQGELSEIDLVRIQHMQKIENEMIKLISDIQYLDSKNPVISKNMKKVMIELITNLWMIGRIARTYKKENQLAYVSQVLSKYEKIYLKQTQEPKCSREVAHDYNEIRKCQSIINESLRPINSTIEYYNMLMSRLSHWGFEVKDPLGQKYDVHMDINVLAFEDSDDDLKVPMITETKKPEIYLNDKKIANALVIVTKAKKKVEKESKKDNKKNYNGDKND